MSKDPSRGVEHFLNILDTQNLQLQLPPGIITYERRGSESTLDLIFATADIAGRVITYNTCPRMDHDSDHIPVETTIVLKTLDQPSARRRNWDKINHKTFNLILEENFPSLQDCIQGDLKQATTRVIDALTEAVAKSVPMSHPSERSLPYFTPECKEACRETNRIRRRWQSSRSEEDHERYRKACNHKKWIISKNLTDFHRGKVEQASQNPKGLWKLNKWI